MIEIKVLTPQNWEPYSSELQKLESLTEYPFGSDFFRIDHGASYFGFFERLGDPVFHVALRNHQVIACLAGVLRRIPVAGGFVQAWYLCDLKVHPDFRGQRLPTRLFQKNILFNYLRCGRGYAISMNPPDRPNRVIKLAQKFSWLAVQVAGQINLYTLDQDQALKVQPQLSSIVGPVSYLSLAEKKDLVMKSSNQRLKLLHLQHGPFARPQFNQPQMNHTHMVCAVAGSRLDQFLGSQLSASAQACILAHRMTLGSWDWILTSDI